MDKFGDSVLEESVACKNAPSSSENNVKGDDLPDLEVLIATSSLCEKYSEFPADVCRMVNGAYGYNRLSPQEVLTTTTNFCSCY